MCLCKFVKVVDIVEDAIYWGKNNEDDFKRVEVVEETGRWMKRSEIIIKPHERPYGDLKIGDKLFIKCDLEQCEDTRILSRVNFEECPNCLSAKGTGEHTCPSEPDSIRIKGCGVVLAINQKNGWSKFKLLIEQGNLHYVYKSFLPGVCNFKKGEIVSISGF